MTTKTQKKATPLEIAQKEVGLLKRERNALKEKCDDLAAQNLTLSSNRVLTPEMEAEFSRLRQEYESAKEQIDKIAKWLRYNRTEEIANGRHAGKDLADVVIGYMEMETREFKKGPVCSVCSYCTNHCTCTTTTLSPELGLCFRCWG